MGTRGLLGVRIDGRDKLTYNHFDSYPEGLGKDVLLALRSLATSEDLKAAMAKARAIRLVKEDSKPRMADIEKCKMFADTGVSSRQLTDWYCLLRKAQGNLLAYLDLGIMIDNHGFIRNSLFCEWAYIANFDTMRLEVYTGFQDKPHTNGRYAKKKLPKTGREIADKYYPCALLVEFDLKALPTVERFHEAIKMILPPEEE
jgi:hypothetical protein